MSRRRRNRRSNAAHKVRTHNKTARRRRHHSQQGGFIIKVVFNLASVVVVQRECTHTAKERRALSYKSGVFCFGGLVLQKKLKKMPRVFRVYMKP